jgi:hypothetical protein
MTFFLALLSYSYSCSYSFLKVMACEGHEHHTKHRQDVGGSLTHAPTARNKKLAKRRRPCFLHEESSPEDSPHRGGTPESPDEVECLKMRSTVDRASYPFGGSNLGHSIWIQRLRIEGRGSGDHRRRSHRRPTRTVLRCAKIHREEPRRGRGGWRSRW